MAPRVLSAVTLATLTMVVSLPGFASAQGTMSTQGLGFPPGQLSTGSMSMGGATGESDPLSPLNPAALRLRVAPVIAMQVAPEFRSTRLDNRKLNTSVARFPLFHAAMPVSSRWTVGASVSTLLDRTWETTARDTQVVNDDTISSTFGQRSEGSISDVRLAAAFVVTPWLRIGFAGHGITGRDVFSISRVFDDTAGFAPDSQQTTIGFGGNAISVGLQTLWPRVAAVGLSYRRGGRLRAYSGNETIASAFVPDHFGASFVYLGISGTTLAVRAARDNWTRLARIGNNMNAHDAWDFGVGGDVTGPRFGGAPVALRLGMRWRTLPFSATTTAVRERTVSGGIAFPMAGDRVELSLGALRSARTGGGSIGGATGLSENAWTLSTGFAVRP